MDPVVVLLRQDGKRMSEKCCSTFFCDCAPLASVINVGHKLTSMSMMPITKRTPDLWKKSRLRKG